MVGHAHMQWSEPKLDRAMQELGYALSSVQIAEVRKNQSQPTEYAKQVGYGLMCAMRAVEAMQQLAEQHRWTDSDLNPCGHYVPGDKTLP